MISYTQYSLTKIENLFRDLGFKIRYEKGNFKSGTCFILQSKVIVINKFVTLEQKINSMIDMLVTEEINESLIDEKQREFMRTIRQTRLEI
jgi:hypothetical protein